jgi:hypothetical protein
MYIPQECMGVLAQCFGDSERDKVMRHFMERGAYDLYVEDQTSTTQLHVWPRFRPGTKIVMSVVFEEGLVGESSCPRCKAWNNRTQAMVGLFGKYLFIFSCNVDIKQVTAFSGRFQITNATRKSNKGSSKFGQNAQVLRLGRLKVIIRVWTLSLISTSGNMYVPCIYDCFRDLCIKDCPQLSASM